MSRRDLGVLCGITVVAAALRFATLDVQSYHHDEAVTAGRVILPDLLDTLEVVRDSERSPPLYYLAAWLWTKLFGTGEVGLRSLSALIGTLTVPAAFLAGRELASTRAGLLAAVFIACNPYLWWYSQEARSYALLVLLTTFALAFFIRSLRRPSRASLSLWAAGSALSVLTHYFALFLVVPQAVWLLWRSTDAARRGAVIAVSATAAVGVALIPLAIAQQGEGRRNGFTEIALASRVGEAGLGYVAGEEPDPFAGGPSVDAVQTVAAAAGVLFVLAAITLLLARDSPADREAAVLAGAVAATAMVVPIVLALAGVDFVNPRNLIGGLVPLLLVGAVAFGAKRSGAWGPIGAALACLTFLAVILAVSSSAQMQRHDWREVAEAIGAADRPRIIVTNRNGDDPLEYYLGAREFDRRSFSEGARVRDLYLVSTRYAIKEPPGFELAGERRFQPLFILRRFTSDRSRVVRPAQFGGRRVLSERSETLIQAPGP